MITHFFSPLKKFGLLIMCMRKAWEELKAMGYAYAQLESLSAATRWCWRTKRLRWCWRTASRRLQTTNPTSWRDCSSREGSSSTAVKAGTPLLVDCVSARQLQARSCCCRRAWNCGWG